MKILFIFFHFYPNIGGTEIVIWEYAKELVKRGHEVTICTANALKFKPANLPAEEMIDGILVKRFKIFPQIYQYLFFSPQILKYLMKVEPDIIQVFSILPSFMLLSPCIIAKIRNIPLILYPQFLYHRFYYHPNTIKKIFGVLFDRIIGRNIIRLGDGIICLTKREAQQINKNKSIIIYEPTIRTYNDKEEFFVHKTIDLLLEFKIKYDIKDNVIILAIGRIEMKKGIHNLIQSFPTILQKSPNAKLLIIGEDGGYLSNCISLAKKLRCENSIIFTGRVDDKDVESAYAICTMAIMPSYYEMLGRTALEAWVYKKPVIVTKECGIAELVALDCGIVIKDNDPNSIASAIIKIIDNPDRATQMGEKGYELVKTLTLENIVTKIEDFYEHVV